MSRPAGSPAPDPARHPAGTPAPLAAGEPARPRTIHEWLAGHPCPWPALSEVPDGGRLVGCYRVEHRQLLRTRYDRPYLRLRLADRRGTIEARVWEDAERADAIARIGGYVGVRGRVESYARQRQLRIEEIAPLAVAADDLHLFLPASPRDPAEMDAELDATIASVRDPGLRALLERLLGADTPTGQLFRRAPAAHRLHHACVGGLLEHTLSVARIADFLAAHYGPEVDRDLLVAGACLHDVGKIRELAPVPGFPYTDEGRLLGHIVLGLHIVATEAAALPELEPERRLLLLHLIASHQGKYEWHSPETPKVLEALLLHHADDLDAKVHQARTLLATVPHGWTAYDPGFAREFLRHRPPHDPHPADPPPEP